MSGCLPSERSHAAEVSVLMPVFNCQRYVRAAVESILLERAHKLELVVIDDGFTDGTAAILAELGARDGRMRIYHQKNQGVTASLNFGIGVCGGRFIARMDADDVSLPNRLDEQVRYLSRHSDVGMVSGGFVLIDAEGAVIGGGRHQRELSGPVV
jgi:glycosyltransferase involved in cell wall biosynthesis